MRTLKPLLLVVALAGCGPAVELDADEYGTTSQDLVVCAAGPTVRGIDASTSQGTGRE